MAHGQDEPSNPRHRGTHPSTATASTTTATLICEPTTSWPIRPLTSPTGEETGCVTTRRWEFGVPPKGNANFAWVQHFLYHLAPRGICRLRTCKWLHVVEPVRRGRDTQEHCRGRPGGLHHRFAGSALPLDPDPSLPLVPVPKTVSTERTGIARAKQSSSTPASWDTCSTAPAATCPRRK